MRYGCFTGPCQLLTRLSNMIKPVVAHRYGFCLVSCVHYLFHGEGNFYRVPPYLTEDPQFRLIVEILVVLVHGVTQGEKDGPEIPVYPHELSSQYVLVSHFIFTNFFAWVADNRALFIIAVKVGVLVEPICQKQAT